MNVGGSLKPVPMISKKRNKILKKNNIYQNSKDKKVDTKLTSAEAGRNVITEASR